MELEEPENLLVREDCGGVLPLGGEPTVKTTLAGLPEPTTMVPPADGAVMSIALLSALRFSELPLSPSGPPNAAINNMSDRRPALCDLPNPRPSSAPLSSGLQGPMSPEACLLLGEARTRPCCARKVTMLGELGGLGNSNGGIALTLTPDEGLTLEGEPRMVGRGLLCMSSLRRGEEWRGRRAIMPP